MNMIIETFQSEDIFQINLDDDDMHLNNSL